MAGDATLGRRGGDHGEAAAAERLEGPLWQHEFAGDLFKALFPAADHPQRRAGPRRSALEAARALTELPADQWHDLGAVSAACSAWRRALAPTRRDHVLHHVLGVSGRAGPAGQCPPALVGLAPAEVVVGLCLDFYAGAEMQDGSPFDVVSEQEFQEDAWPSRICDVQLVAQLPADSQGLDGPVVDAIRRLVPMFSAFSRRLLCDVPVVWEAELQEPTISLSMDGSRAYVCCLTAALGQARVEADVFCQAGCLRTLANELLVDLCSERWKHAQESLEEGARDGVPKVGKATVRGHWQISSDPPLPDEERLHKCEAGCPVDAARGPLCSDCQYKLHRTEAQLVACEQLVFQLASGAVDEVTLELAAECIPFRVSGRDSHELYDLVADRERALESDQSYHSGDTPASELGEEEQIIGDEEQVIEDEVT